MEVMDVGVYFINVKGLSRHPEQDVFISILCLHDDPQLASPYRPLRTLTLLPNLRPWALGAHVLQPSSTLSKV